MLFSLSCNHRLTVNFEWLLFPTSYIFLAIPWAKRAFSLFPSSSRADWMCLSAEAMTFSHTVKHVSHYGTFFSPFFSQLHTATKEKMKVNSGWLQTCSLFHCSSPQKCYSPWFGLFASLGAWWGKSRIGRWSLYLIPARTGEHILQYHKYADTNISVIDQYRLIISANRYIGFAWALICNNDVNIIVLSNIMKYIAISVSVHIVTVWFFFFKIVQP